MGKWRHRLIFDLCTRNSRVRVLGLKSDMQRMKKAREGLVEQHVESEINPCSVEEGAKSYPNQMDDGAQVQTLEDKQIMEEPTEQMFLKLGKRAELDANLSKALDLIEKFLD